MAGPFIPHIHAPELIVKPIVLLGPPNAGKTTVGKELARLMDVLWFDIDTMIARKLKIPPEKLWNSVDMTTFQELESECFYEAFNFGRTEAKVISPGCGILHCDQMTKTIKEECNAYYLKHYSAKSLIRNGAEDRSIKGLPDITEDDLHQFHQLFSGVLHQLAIKFEDTPTGIALAIRNYL